MGGTVLLLSRWDGVNLGGVLKRPRRTLLWALTISSFWGAAGSVDSVVEPQLELDSKREHANDAAELTLFSPQWATTYGEGENGCEQGRGSYTWRPYGFGSNMNNLLNAWVYALSVEKWNDLALVIEPGQLDHVDCTEHSDGHATQGWNCLFDPMPHVCVFDTNQTWVDHMDSRQVTLTDQVEATRLTLNAVRFAPDVIVDSLESSNVDHMGALAVVSKYLWRHMTPWLQNNIHHATQNDDLQGFNDSPYVGIHVRRGDKVKEGEADLIETERYLASAAEYLRSTEGVTPVEEIEGIWVASDDSSVVDEVKEHWSKYFPNVNEDKIVWISGDGGVATHTNRQGYESFVYMFSDLQQLTLSEVFVGTFSSNVGRLVAVLRDSIHKDRSSAISLDRSATWTAGRRERRERRRRRRTSGV